MNNSIRSELIKRQWLEWAEANLASYSQFDSDTVSNKFTLLRQLKQAGDNGRCYEHKSSSLSVLAEGIMSGIRRMSCARVIAIVGDASAPAVFEMRTDEIPILLEKIASEDETVGLADPHGNGVLTVDISQECATDFWDILVSARGTFENCVDSIKSFVPGGIEFRGN